MRTFQLALLGLASVASAAINDTLDSRQILSTVFRPPQHFRNTNLVRNINLDKSYPHETINVVVENIDKQSQSEYYLPFELGVLARVGGLEVKDKKNPEKLGFLTEVVGIGQDGSAEFYKITLPTALAPNEQITLSISYYVLSAVQPRPAQIGQNDKQYVEHVFSAYSPSAYETLKQKTKLKLPTTDVPDAVTLPTALNAEGKQDPQKQGTTYTYGPYDARPAGSVQDVSVRYEYTKPLTQGTLLERDVEVSHWGGNVAFEERHWLTNRGAALKKQFSRATYQQQLYYNPASVALTELRFPLTLGSLDAYYIDDIGNVSTSRFRSNARESLLEIKPRYPLFGKWNYSFKVGWNVDAKTLLRKIKGTSDGYVLKVPFFEGPKLANGVEYQRVVLRVILPEGATNVQYETSIPIVSQKTSLHRTFMDTLGRTSLELVAINIVDEFSGRDLIVTYDLPYSAQFRKPLTVVAGTLVVFAACWIVGNLDISIGRKQKTA